MFKLLTISLFSTLFLALPTYAGPGTSGGGDGSRAEFYYLGDILFKELDQLQLSAKPLDLARQAFAELRLKEKKYPEFTDLDLVLNGQTVTAINDYGDFTIVVNEPRWNRSTFSQKRQLILHELLGLSRKYDISIDDSGYAISSPIMAKLAKVDQKNFLLNTDYPANFVAPELMELNASVISDIKIARSKTRTGLAQATAENCIATDIQPAIGLHFKRESDLIENKYTLQFKILCKEPDGHMYGHSQGADEIGSFDLVSNNLFEMNSEIGSFILGWISGQDFLVRSPGMLIKLEKNKDGTYNFTFEFYRGPNGPAERITGILKRN